MAKDWYSYKADTKWASTRPKSGKLYDLTTVGDRILYFQEKVGKEIALLRDFLSRNTFVGYLLAPKNAGKGTYMKYLAEAVGEQYFNHVGVGDVVKKADEDFREKNKDSDVYKYMQSNYRGYISLDEAFDALVGRSTKTLVPTEFILALIKREIDANPRKALFIDGFPRNMDQISYSLYFRQLINYRDDPDLFVLINAPFAVLEGRIKSRVVCPICKTPRSVTLNPTQYVGYDEEKKEFYIMCDKESCNKARMIAKEGDDLGLLPIRDRILTDIALMDKARNLYGVPKIELYNAFETNDALELFEEYEITTEDEFYFDDHGEIQKRSHLWEVEDDGKKYYSLYPPAVVVQLIKQIVSTFDLK